MVSSGPEWNRLTSGGRTAPIMATETVAATARSIQIDGDTVDESAPAAAPMASMIRTRSRLSISAIPSTTAMVVHAIHALLLSHSTPAA